MSDQTNKALKAVRDEMGQWIADPMWADHAEMPKMTLKRWHHVLHAALSASAPAEPETEYCDDGLSGEPTPEVINEWLESLARAHEWLDAGKPYFSGRDCAALARLIKNLAGMAASAPAAVSVPSDDEILDVWRSFASLRPYMFTQEIIAFARALLAQYGSPAWQPIETAPKDGTSVLLRGHGDHRIADGYWLKAAYNGNGAWVWPYVHREPVHWMSLPPAPQEGK